MNVEPGALAPTAVILRDGAMLLAQRPCNKSFGGLWETPGGKAEPGESAVGALTREIGEELGCACEIGAQISQINLEPPVTSRHYNIPIFQVTLIGEPVPLAASQLQWFPVAALKQLDAVTPATRVAIAAVLARECAVPPARVSAGQSGSSRWMEIDLINDHAAAAPPLRCQIAQVLQLREGVAPTYDLVAVHAARGPFSLNRIYTARGQARLSTTSVFVLTDVQLQHLRTTGRCTIRHANGEIRIALIGAVGAHA